MQTKKPRSGSDSDDVARAVEASANGELQLRLGASDALVKASLISLVGLFVVALMWCAYVARPVILPVVLAWVIATVVLPLVTRMHERGLPRAVAAMIVTALLALLISSLLLLLSTPVAYWIGRASEFGALVKAKLQGINQPLALLQEIQKSLSAIGAGDQPALRVEQHTTTVLETIFSTLTPAVSQALLFVGALVFYLVYQKRIRNSIVYIFKDRDERLGMLRILSEIDESMSVYFGTFTIVNVCLAIVTMTLTWIVGLPNPLLWGVLAGVLNYVPYIGPGIVTGTLAVVGLMTFSSLTQALIAPAVFLAIVTIEGNFITPTVMGRRLELNPFAVFLSIAFCTWLWGPIGAFLAVPLLLATTMMLVHILGEEKPELPD